MGIIAKIFYTILLIGSGILILKYRRTVKSWTGNFVWAEQYLGRGGTYFIIMLIAIAMIFLGFLYPFGGLDFIFGTTGNTTNLKVNFK